MALTSFLYLLDTRWRLFGSVERKESQLEYLVKLWKLTHILWNLLCNNYNYVYLRLHQRKHRAGFDLIYYFIFVTISEWSVGPPRRRDVRSDVVRAAAGAAVAAVAAQLGRPHGAAGRRRRAQARRRRLPAPPAAGTRAHMMYTLYCGLAGLLNLTVALVGSCHIGTHFYFQ